MAVVSRLGFRTLGLWVNELPVRGLRPSPSKDRALRSHNISLPGAADACKSAPTAAPLPALRTRPIGQQLRRSWLMSLVYFRLIR